MKEGIQVFVFLSLGCPEQGKCCGRKMSEILETDNQNGFCVCAPGNGALSKGMIKINLQRAHERRRKINASHRLHGSFTSKVPVLHLSLYTKAQELVLTC